MAVSMEALDRELREHIERRDKVIDAIRDILVDNLDVQIPKGAIDPDVPLFGTGLALDSVDAVELVISAEVRFGIALPQTVMRHGLRTVNTLADLVLSLSPRLEGVR